MWLKFNFYLVVIDWKIKRLNSVKSFNWRYIKDLVMLIRLILSFHTIVLRSERQNKLCAMFVLCKAYFKSGKSVWYYFILYDFSGKFSYYLVRFSWLCLSFGFISLITLFGLISLIVFCIVWFDFLTLTLQGLK